MLSDIINDIITSKLVVDYCSNSNVTGKSLTMDSMMPRIKDSKLHITELRRNDFAALALCI